MFRRRQQPQQGGHWEHPCQVHPDDEDIVTEADHEWLRSVHPLELAQALKDDEVAQAGLYLACLEQGRNKDEAARIVHQTFAYYYIVLPQRDDHSCAGTPLTGDDSPLPIFVKGRVVRNVMKIAPESGVTMNAQIREALREGRLRG